MTRFSQLMQSCALACCLPATAALADLTAADVWTDWEELMTSSGYTLNADQSSTSDSVTVSNMTLEMDLSEGDDNGTVTVDLGTMRFVESGDGKVTIEVPDQAAINVSMTPAGEESVAATINTVMTDQAMSASGDPDDITYDFTATKTVISLASLTVDGAALGPDVASAEMTLENLAYVTRKVAGDLLNLEQTTTASGMNYQVSFVNPVNSESFKMNGNVRDLAFKGGGVLPLIDATDDANAMLNAGMEFGGTFTTSGGGYDLTFKGSDGGGTINATSTGAEFRFAINPSGFDYGVTQTGVAANVLLTEFPLPISFGAEKMATNFKFPVQKSEDAQDFAMGVTLNGLTVSDTVWGLFDPTGQLPRSPATLVVDLDGTAKVLFDVLDPAQAEVLSMSETAPGQLQSLNLNALELDAAGAKLTGDGAFTFDNADMVTFDGFPRPQGGINLTLVGANVLIDKLVNMGLLPQEQAMGARMMMGLFAVPGEGEDTLNSRIEVTPEGQVMANGQRLR